MAADRDVYDDPDFIHLPPRWDQGPFDKLGDLVHFNMVGDWVRGRIIAVQKFRTQYGPTLGLVLFVDGHERTLLTGPKSLRDQVFQQRPGRGDTIEAQLVKLKKMDEGTAKIFTVNVGRVSRRAVARVAPLPAVTPDGPEEFNWNFDE